VTAERGCNVPISLTVRLLCAARHAYDITASGDVAGTSDSARIGFIDAIEGFAVGIDRIDAGLVGETAEAIIVAFRGTLPADSPDHAQAILDWADDCDALLVADPGVPGCVHQGFLGALTALWPGIEPAVKARSAASPSKPVYLTGHSKGGPLANLAAMRLRSALPAGTPILVATFAGVRPGDPAFAAAYDAAIPHSARYEFADDIVPHLPPSDEFLMMFRNIPHISDTLQRLTRGYASVGELYFIDWSGSIVGDAPLLRFERFTHLARQMTNFGFATLAADHDISIGSGYDKAIGV
jgi:hypothetical protein